MNMETKCFSETSALTGATLYKVPEEIFQDSYMSAYVISQVLLRTSVTWHCPLGNEALFLGAH
jgi:hypothetical protein